MSFAPEFYWENGRRYHQGGGCSADPVSSKQLLIHPSRIYPSQRPGNLIPQFLNTHSTHVSIQTELDREDMKHHEFMLITDFRLLLSPIGDNPQRILDIGSGTGGLLYAIMSIDLN